MIIQNVKKKDIVLDVCGYIVCNIYFISFINLNPSMQSIKYTHMLHVSFATSFYGLGFKIPCVEGLITTWFL